MYLDIVTVRYTVQEDGMASWNRPGGGGRGEDTSISAHRLSLTSTKLRTIIWASSETTRERLVDDDLLPTCNIRLVFNKRRGQSSRDKHHFRCYAGGEREARRRRREERGSPRD